MAASSDTLRLAAEERAKQGMHELEISFDGELDLHKHYKNCQKNPRHQKFIPILKLQNSHNIPIWLIPWVRCLSHFTVKLSVNYVSSNRPPGYPLSDRAGQKVLSVGSGYVTDFSPSGNNDELPCPFTDCGELAGNHEVYGYITLVTAAHVVFDDEEAKNTTVEFFYDDPDDKSGVVTARGVKVAASSVEGDFCELLCVTHDGSLFQRLNDLHGYMSGFPVKLSVNYASPNRRPRNQLSGHAGRRVQSIGSGYVTDFPSSVTIFTMKCPFTMCSELRGNHEVWGYITVVIAAHVVFDDEEAKNTTFEFFYDGPDGRIRVVTARGVKLRASSVKKDFCELLCVTHDKGLYQHFDWFHGASFHFRKVGQIYNLFRNILPALENIEYVAGTNLTFLVKIRLNNPSEAVKAFLVLGTFTENIVKSILAKFNISAYSLREVLMSNTFTKENLLTVIDFVLQVNIKLIKDNKSTVSYSNLIRTLRHLRLTVISETTISHETTMEFFMSLISELAQWYSTVESLEKKCSLLCDDTCDKFNSRNKLKVVNISNGTATVEVSLLRQLDEYLGIPRDVNWIWPTFLSYNDDEYEPDPNESNPDMLLVHIAHPHGQSKQVTIGRQTDCFTGDGFYHQLYTAPTCPGCSGGPVWMIPASGDLRQVYGVPHSGHHGNELNTGCSWTVYPHKF